MKVHLIKKQTIEEYVRGNSQSKSAFQIWLSILKRADWNEILKTFNSADILGNGSDRVVFNIGGNKYRLIAKYNFGESRVHLFMNWIGTHAEYTKLCNSGKQYEINLY